MKSHEKNRDVLRRAITIEKLSIATILLVFIVLGTSSASDISVGSATIDWGDTAEIPVMVGNITNATGIDLELTFDPTVVVATGLKNSTFVAFNLSAIDNKNGSIRVVMVLSNYPTIVQPTEIARIYFRGIDAGTSDLNITMAEYSGQDFNTSYFDNVVNGSITVNKVNKTAFFNVAGNAKVLWNASYSNISVWDTSVLEDLNGDGAKDFVFAIHTYDPNEGGMVYKVVALNGVDGSELWNVPLASHEISHITADDLNGDGLKDIVIFCGDAIFAVRNDGSLLVTYINSSLSISHWNYGITDVDNDGFKEIIVGATDSDWFSSYVVNGYVVAIDFGFNNVLWVRSFVEEWPNVISGNAASEGDLDKNAVMIVTTAQNEIAGYDFSYYSWGYDFDNNGRKDVLLKYSQGGKYVLEAINGSSGETFWTRTFDYEPNVYSPVDDKDGDGIEDVLVSLDGPYTVILSGGNNGNELFNVSQKLITPCLDADLDGACEFLTYDKSSVYVRDNTGNAEWNYELGDFEEVTVAKGSIVVYGNNYDWKNHTGNFKLVKLEVNGNELWNLSRDYVSNAGLDLFCVGDLTGDGVLDYVVRPYYGVGYALAVNGADGSIIWEKNTVFYIFLGDFDGDGKGDLFNVTEFAGFDSDKYLSGIVLTGDNLAYIFNVSSSDQFMLIQPFYSYDGMGYDVNGDGAKDLIAVLNPYEPNSSIYVITVKQPPAPKPDLTVSIECVDHLNINEQLQINLTVKNIGSANSNSTTLDLYVSGTRVQTFNVPQLAPNAEAKFSYSYTFTSEGLHEIKAVVDPGNANDELNELNNFSIAYVYVIKPKPDLVGILHVYDEFGNETMYIKKHKAGDSYGGTTYSYPFVVVNSTFEIRNLIPGVTVDKTFDLSATYKGHSYSTSIGQEELNDLNADGVLNLSDTAVVDASSIDVGCYTFNITVDSNNDIEEINEGNNNATRTLCISQPDLVPIVLAPDLINPGTANFEIVVVNIGDVWAKQTNASLYINNNLVNTYSIPLLKPGEFWNISVNYNFPAGIHNITLVADSDDVEAELNEGNNTFTKMLTAAILEVNGTVIPNTTSAMLGDTVNVSIELNSSLEIDSVNLYLIYNYKAFYFVSASSDYNLNYYNMWGWPYRAIRITGDNINASGKFLLANLTFRVKTDKYVFSWFNLTGNLISTNNLYMKVVPENASVVVSKVTDIQPYIYGYYSYYVVGDEANFDVIVRNLRKTEVDSYVLNVSVYNENGLQEVLFNKTMQTLLKGPALTGYGWNVTKITWNTTGYLGGKYWIVAKVSGDTITANNVYTTHPITLKEFHLDAWRMYYPRKVMMGREFWIGSYVNVTAPGKVNATIKVPDGLLVWNGTGWNDTAKIERFLWGGKWNWFGFRLKAVKVGEYGNGTTKEINITFTGRDKVDEINSSSAVDQVPDYKLIVWVPTIKLRSYNTTILSDTSNEMTFKTIDTSNVTTFSQKISLVVLAGQEGRVLRGLDYLVQYPYGCVEQTTSRLLGALHTDWYYRTKGYPDVYDSARVNKSIMMGVQSLAKGGVRGQHDNGSWSMWGWNPKGDGFYTMYASYGLGRVAEDDVFGYLVKNNLTTTHVYSSSVNKGKFNFNDTIYWFAQAANRNETTGAIWWEPWQGTHWFFQGHLPVTSWIMVSHYQLINEGLINSSAKQVANQTMANVTKYLVSVQNSDGGWNQWGAKDDPAKPSDAISTALSVWGLKLYGTPSDEVNRSQIENAIEKGVAWLLNNTYSAAPDKVYWHHPLASPWWDNYGRKSEATAYAIIALNESRSMNNLNFTVLDSNNATIAKAVNYLVSVYRGHGSFGYTASTQAALHALTLLQVVPMNETTVTINIDNGAVVKDVTVNSTNPKVIIVLTPDELNAVNSNGTSENTNRRIHTVNVTRVSGDSLVIVSVENEQTVAQTDLIYGTDYVGHKILEVGSGSGTVKIASMEVQQQNELTILPTLPDNMVEGKSYEVTVRVDNNNATALLSPVITVPLGTMNFDSSVTPRWFDSALGWNNFIDGKNFEYDSVNNTLKFYPDQVPGTGYIDIRFNVTPSAGDTTLEVKMFPMYNEENQYIANTTKYVKGYGNISLKIFNASGAALDASVTLDGAAKTSKIQAIEGSHKIRISKSGYVPVEFDVSLNPGDNVTYSVALYKPEELTQPKVVFAEATEFNDMNTIMSVSKDLSITPNASVKASKEYMLSLGGVGKKKIAIPMPKFERGNLWAWINDSVTVEVNGQAVQPEEVTIGNEKVLILDVDGSATVNVTFEGRKLGDVDGDSGVTDWDSWVVLRYNYEKTLENMGIQVQRHPDTSYMWSKSSVYGDVDGDSGVTDWDSWVVLRYNYEKTLENMGIQVQRHPDTADLWGG
ncbi:hypothetical protein Asulf_01871 [Archaeoglobus sulfaticallidus PM70-1]|uniref:CARDB domain-containing protein n=1 Tax=Archaeoglobus sulfaticallidus PM70-1 TaxID=387631 RepID=N0BHP8_9EURY|nr:CARDB domain-containing protein [Archaeoglobus sulfaticallidus]AGK61837.1 hypothetical protein Asulf_01871 [Archaeoglobus sulfaticallidus PM70-1]